MVQVSSKFCDIENTLHTNGTVLHKRQPLKYDPVCLFHPSAWNSEEMLVALSIERVYDHLFAVIV